VPGLARRCCTLLDSSARTKRSTRSELRRADHRIVEMFKRPPPLSQSDSIEGSQIPASAIEDIERPAHLAPHSSSPQFQVVIDLYECLRDEKKLEKRRGYLDTWFKVKLACQVPLFRSYHATTSEMAKERRTRPLSRDAPHSSPSQSITVHGVNRFIDRTEFPRKIVNAPAMGSKSTPLARHLLLLLG
jgi:hypothetical protein